MRWIEREPKLLHGAERELIGGKRDGLRGVTLLRAKEGTERNTKWGWR